MAKRTTVRVKLHTGWLEVPGYDFGPVIVARNLNNDRLWAVTDKVTGESLRSFHKLATARTIAEALIDGYPPDTITERNDRATVIMPLFRRALELVGERY